MPSSNSRTTRVKTTGLRYWMLRVLQECENVSADFGPDSVHDLRVCLRRCRSLADGLMALDPDPDWKAMRKAGKNLFQRLGVLRDIHVMEEWVHRLEQPGLDAGESSAMLSSPPHAGIAGIAAQPVVDPGHALLKILASREQEQKREAQAAIEEFDRKQWRQWSKSRPARAARFRAGSALFKHLALERWTEARALHTRAMRSRSQIALHSLRIGIKRFRYIVENFLPAEHRAWRNDLKEIQDWLGEVHDLDVLWNTALARQVFHDAVSRNLWRQRILSERNHRIERYRARMTGVAALWEIWRAALPQGKQIQALATRRMKLWANGLDPDFPHSQRVATLALQLYDGLVGTGWHPAAEAASARFSLFAAAVLHEVGKSRGEKGHHKTSFDLIRAHGNPVGWNAAEMQRAAIVARFHRGALPNRKHKLLRDLLPDEQKATIQLAAILRLTNALDAGHDGHIHRIQIGNVPNDGSRQKRTRLFPGKATHAGSSEPLVIAAEGYSPLGSSAQIIAAERHLLETVLRRPVLIKAMKRTANRKGAAR